MPKGSVPKGLAGWRATHKKGSTTKSVTKVVKKKK